VRNVTLIWVHFWRNLLKITSFSLLFFHIITFFIALFLYYFVVIFLFGCFVVVLLLSGVIFRLLS